MHNLLITIRLLLLGVFIPVFFNSCVNSRQIAYFNDVKDSTHVASEAVLEPVIQKKDLLSIAVSSVSNDAAVIFNTPNISSTTNNSGSSPQTSGYLVSQAGSIKFPLLGDIPAFGLTQKQLEDTITKMLIDKKLLFDPIVAIRYLNFRVTVLGEVNKPGVVTVPSEQISVLEAIGQAGDLTIFGKRDNIILVRQEGGNKIVRRLNLNSSQILQSPFFFLKSNDVLYVEPGKAKVASTSPARQLLPVIFSGLSLVVIILNSLIK